MKLAMAQTNSTADLAKNLQVMETLTREAATAGADGIVFPEMAYLSGNSSVWKPVIVEFPKLLETFSRWASKYGIGIIPGTLREPSSDPERYFNTLVVLDKSGKQLQAYRKLHLFQANLPHKKYFEGKYSDSGKDVKVVDWCGMKWGLSVCFDLRFPELFRELRKQGAEAFILPSAFTVPTGEAHWEILVRARAIENQVFMVAPGLVGNNGEGLANYGHSLVVDPWGRALVDLECKEGIAIVELSQALLTEARGQIDAWSCRRSDVFSI